jgi:hypothetical protein
MMTPSQQDRVRALFHGALELTPDERVSYLRKESAGDEEVRLEVESLLATHALADGFLSQSPIGAPDADEPPPLTLLPGTRLGPFEILTRLGTGGMGEVYKAQDTRLDRSVAIKVLAPDLAGEPHRRERFEREARLISMLTHPHICALYDVGTASIGGSEMPYLVMELLTGETLASRLRRGPLPIDQALKCGTEIVDALAAAHALGIVHRDLKPGNIMLTASGVKLLDFGLARLRAASAPAGDAHAGLAAEPLTFEGSLIGTLPYMAPEQVRGEAVDARSDLFAFGAVMYEMLTGTRAFEGDSQAGLVAAILEREPHPLASRRPLVSSALDRLVSACLAKDPGERCQHAHDVRLELQAIAEGRPDAAVRSQEAAEPIPSHARRQWRMHAAWAVALLVVGLALWWSRPRGGDGAPPLNPTPVIVLMDSPLPGRVYDPRTLAAGGTNADDITDILRELPVLTHKENTSPMWHREEQVRQQNPDLIISHLSCLFDVRMANNDAKLRQHLFDLAENRLEQFFGYIGSVNPRTRFLVYSRGRYTSPEAEAAWADNVVARFPQLKGRLFAMMVPGGDAATFRDAQTANLVRSRVSQILMLR